MKYLKDERDRRKTPYDFFSVNPDTPIREIRKRYKAIISKHQELSEEAQEMLRQLTTPKERLMIDFLYYSIPEKSQRSDSS